MPPPMEREYLKQGRTPSNTVKDQLQSQSDAERRQPTIRGSTERTNCVFAAIAAQLASMSWRLSLGEIQNRRPM